MCYNYGAEQIIMCYTQLNSTLKTDAGALRLYTLNHKKTWHFIFDYNFGKS